MGAQRCRRATQASVDTTRCCREGASQPSGLMRFKKRGGTVAQFAAAPASHSAPGGQRFTDLPAAMCQFEEIEYRCDALNLARGAVNNFGVTDQCEPCGFAARVEFDA